MANVPLHSAGRPGSALLILGAIFTTAVLLRVPIGPSPIEPRLWTLTSDSRAIWSAPPVVSMHHPAMEAQSVAEKHIAISPTPTRSAPIQTASIDTISESPQHEVAARTASVVDREQPPMIMNQPTLSAAPHNDLTGLAAPVTPVSFVESSSSNPFSAVGTAFVKTGAALTLAFKKTGQGILAPF